MWNLKNDTNELTYKTVRDSPAGGQRAGGEGFGSGPPLCLSVRTVPARRPLLMRGVQLSPASGNTTPPRPLKLRDGNCCPLLLLLGPPHPSGFISS